MNKQLLMARWLVLPKVATVEAFGFAGFSLADLDGRQSANPRVRQHATEASGERRAAFVQRAENDKRVAG
jgi:hypothetical protein